MRAFRPRGRRTAAGGRLRARRRLGHGQLDSYDAPLRALANATGAIVAGVDYRLAPEHRFPAALDDSLAAIRWLAAHADELGGDGSRLAVAGDSAGGNLAAVAARRLRGELPIALQVLIYPVTDAGVNLPSYREFADGHGLSAASMRRVLEPLPRRRRRQRPGRVAAARGRPRGRGAGVRAHGRGGRPARRGRGVRGRAARRRRRGRARALARRRSTASSAGSRPRRRRGEAVDAVAARVKASSRTGVTRVRHGDDFWRWRLR